MSNTILNATGIQQQQILTMLYKNSLGSIPFNIALASFLALDLLYKAVPHGLIAIWYGLIFIISIFRWFYSQWNLKKHFDLMETKKKIHWFTFFTFLMGSAWGSCYFIFINYLDSPMTEFIIVLVLAGMCAGSIASLSMYLPAYYAYILPIFIPIIFYNYFLFEIDRIIMASMYFLFILMLMVSAKLSCGLLIQNFKLGEEKDWLIKKLSETNHELEISNAQLQSVNEEIRVISITDVLTGLYNRRHFNGILHAEIERARRKGHLIHLILMDIDNFKHINDTYGHLGGDQFLVKIAEFLKSCLRRNNDMLFRFGGDEFAALLIDSSQEEAIKVCHYIQTKFKENIMVEKLSISIGIMSITPDSPCSLKTIMTKVDKALYQAKKRGKNQVYIVSLEE